MQNQIFRKYDIRGKVGTELFISEVANFTKALIFYLQLNYKILNNFCIAMDGRIHSNLIAKELIAVLIENGYLVKFLGVCPTPVLMYALNTFDFDVGIMITASHNTKDYNGFKLFYKNKAICGDEIALIRDLYNTKSFLELKKPVLLKNGKVVNFPIIDDYINSLCSEFSHLSQYDFKFVIDCGNGTTGPILKKIIKKMNWSFVELLFEAIDGNFPNHEADPTVLENMQTLIAVLRNKTNSYFGIGFDGDGDRMIGVSAAGELILGDVMLSIFAQEIAKKNTSFSVVSDIKASSLVADVVEKNGGKIFFTPTGSHFIKEKMKIEKAILGGEVSGHYFFNDRHACYDDAIYALLRLFELLAHTKENMSELLARFPKKYTSLEIRIPCDDSLKDAIISKVEADFVAFKKWKISKIDGIKIEDFSASGLLRASNTQPVLSLRCEANSEVELIDLKQQFAFVLKKYISESIINKYLL